MHIKCLLCTTEWARRMSREEAFFGVILLCMRVTVYKQYQEPGLSHFYNWQYFQHNMYVISDIKNTSMWYKRYGFQLMVTWELNFTALDIRKPMRNDENMMQNKFYDSQQPLFIVFMIKTNSFFVKIWRWKEEKEKFADILLKWF